MAKKVVFDNFKGGAGKTSTSVLTAYELAKKGYKTLVCDIDPQSNATQLLERTYALQHGAEMQVQKSMMVALQKHDLSLNLTKIMDNLYLLPSHKDFAEYPYFLELAHLPTEENYREKRYAYFSKELAKIEDQFDYIIFDVPPTLSIFTDSVLYATDYVIIVLQTQQRSFDGAKDFWEHLQDFYNKYDRVDFDIAGVLSVLLKNHASIDEQILEDSAEVFGEDVMFKTVIRQMERVKRYDRLGICEKGLTPIYDMHDERVHEVYSGLADEVIERTK